MIGMTSPQSGTGVRRWGWKELALTSIKSVARSYAAPSLPGVLRPLRDISGVCGDVVASPYELLAPGGPPPRCELVCAVRRRALPTPGPGRAWPPWRRRAQARRTCGSRMRRAIVGTRGAGRGWRAVRLSACGGAGARGESAMMQLRALGEHRPCGHLKASPTKLALASRRQLPPFPES